MNEAWRTFLYPLGFLSALAFGARFIIQWLESEKAHKSVVSPLFWHISLTGNLLLILHSLIQVQFHICLVQVCNGVISWRNLNLMQTKSPPLSLKTVWLILAFSILFTTTLFLIQDWMFFSTSDWFRIPTAPWQSHTLSSVSPLWHFLGFFGFVLFSSRFWVQWWFAEKKQQSFFPITFWWLSIVGALISIAYFFHIGDSVNLIGPLVGMVPYVRNLMLMYKKEKVGEL